MSPQITAVAVLDVPATGSEAWAGLAHRAGPRSAPDAPARREVFGRITPFERRGLVAASLAVLSIWVVAVAVITYQTRLAAYWRGERDIWGRWQYEPPHEVAPEVLAALPHEEIHGRLLPRWVTAAAHLLDDPVAEAQAYDELRQVLEPDANLTGLFEEQRRIISEGRVLGEAERLHYLIWAWNRYLDRAGLPFLLEGNVGVSRARQSFFYLTSYRTFADLGVTVGGRRCRVRLVGRIDPVNVRELHIGGAQDVEDGAIVVVDRLQEFALDAIWPLLAGVEASPVPAGSFLEAYADRVAAEVEAGIGAEHLAVLRETAEWRARFLDVRESVAERESCSGFLIPHIPFDGPSSQIRDELLARAYISISSSCPQLKVEELIVLHKGSRELQERAGLGAAVAALVAWLARVVAAHEARHLADLDSDGDLEVRCAVCGPDGVTAEVSAYLASFAWSDGPATAYYQACRAVASERNPHAAAMEIIDQWLDTECFLGPPPDLAARARVLEREQLGRAEPITLPVDFPTRLPVSRGVGRRRAVVGEPEPDGR